MPKHSARMESCHRCSTCSQISRRQQATRTARRQAVSIHHPARRDAVRDRASSSMSAARGIAAIIVMVPSTMLEPVSQGSAAR
jgi:hypothetical protein